MIGQKINIADARLEFNVKLLHAKHFKKKLKTITASPK